MRSSTFLVPLTAITWFLAADAVAQLQCATATLQSSSTPGEFGSAVSIFGNTVAVGTLGGGGFHGPVFIYRLENTTWLEQQQLNPSATPYGYGRSLSLSGNVLAVGGDDAVYLYRYDRLSWIEEQVITSADPESIDFGALVTVEGDNLIVGDSYDVQLGETAGAIHVYRFDGVAWAHIQKILSPSGPADRHFGISLDLSGEAIVAGSELSTWVFRFDGASWNYEQELVVPQGYEFGRAVAIDQQTIMVGDISVSDGAGTVYVFEFDGTTWQLAQQLVASDGGDYFGLRISLSESRAVIGAEWHSHEPNFSGAAYVFGFDGMQWVQEQEFIAQIPLSSFARAVAVSGNIAIIGQRGAAHIYCLGPGACCDHASGICTPDTLNATCLGQHKAWYDVPDCSTVSCAPITGACCSAFPELESTCRQTTMADCPIGLSAFFSPDTNCQAVSCRIPCLIQETSGSSYQTFGGFGQTVAVDGQFAVVGADGDEGFYGTGSATVFHLDDGVWSEMEKLLPLDYQDDEQFGRSVDLSGNVVLVGAPSDTAGWTPPPAAYVFRYDGVSWHQEARLTPGDGTRLFGSFVAISGDDLVISARYAAYIFHFDGFQWVPQQVIANPGSVSPVAIDNGVVLIGGKAYRRIGTTWIQEGFVLSDGSLVSTIDIGGFGQNRVSISGDVALFGNAGDNGPDFGTAAIYRFDGSAWVYEQNLVSTTMQINDHFGFSVAIFGDRAVVGAPAADGGAPAIGAASLFRFNGAAWIQESSLIRPETTPLQAFSYAVDFDGLTAIIGDPNGTGLVPSTGTAFAFRVTGVGSCCNRRFGSCTSCELQSDCDDSDQVWANDSSCSLAGCVPALGACCNRAVSDNPTQAECSQTIFSDCICSACEWTIDANCADIACVPTYGPIPTVNEWGLIVLTLCLLIAAKIAFLTRKSVA